MTEIIWTAGAGRELQEVYELLEDYREGVRVQPRESFSIGLRKALAQAPATGSE